jgi:hypothetical protein
VFIDGINGGGIVGLVVGMAELEPRFRLIEGLFVTKGDLISVTKGDFVIAVVEAGKVPWWSSIFTIEVPVCPKLSVTFN